MFLGVCTEGFGAQDGTSEIAYNYFLSYVTGHYFVGKMPPPSIVAFPTTAVVDLETMIVLDRDMHSQSDAMTIEDVLAAVHAANDD